MSLPTIRHTDRFGSNEAVGPVHDAHADDADMTESFGGNAKSRGYACSLTYREHNCSNSRVFIWMQRRSI